MKIGHWIARIGAIGVLGMAGAALAQGYPGVPPGAAPGSMPNDDMNKGLPPQVQQTMELTDAQVKGFFDASDALRAAGNAAAAGNDATSGSPAQIAKGLALNEQSLAIIKKYGFKDATEFQQVGYNAAIAYGVLQQGGKEAVKAKLDKAEAQQKATMEKLRAQVGEEQFKLFQKHASQALSTARTMQDVPDGNIVIMKKYEERMKNLGNE